MARWFNIALLLMVFLSVSLSAQVRGVRFAPTPVSAVHLSGAGHSFTLRPAPVRAEHPFGRPAIFFGDPYFYGDYGFEPQSEPATPEVVVVQAQPAAPAPEKSPPEPLLLELRGDRFVRVGAGDYAPEDDTSVSANSLRYRRSGGSWSAGSRDSAQTPRELPPAVLVFRDGHKEEVRNYTITGPVIYTAADYWTQGSWTRKIQIADLDVASTLKLNQERGANFSLPAGPNEVVVRP